MLIKGANRLAKDKLGKTPLDSIEPTVSVN